MLSWNHDFWIKERMADYEAFSSQQVAKHQGPALPFPRKRWTSANWASNRFYPVENLNPFGYKKLCPSIAVLPAALFIVHLSLNCPTSIHPRDYETLVIT